jgi:hypothetical protein
VAVTDGALIEKGAHIVVVGGTGKPDEASLRRVDVYLRFGDAPAPTGHPELATDAEHIGYEARPAAAKPGDGGGAGASTAIRSPTKGIPSLSSPAGNSSDARKGPDMRSIGLLEFRYTPWSPERRAAASKAARARAMDGATKPVIETLGRASFHLLGKRCNLLVLFKEARPRA